MSREEKRTAIKESWYPTKIEEFPTSNHFEKGKDTTRRLNASHLSTFRWLAVSCVPGYKGCWCIYCVLFKTGDVMATGHKFGKLVALPLTDFSDLTGKNGKLSSHERKEYHLKSQERVANFLRSLSMPEASVVNQIDSSRLASAKRHRSILISVIETLQLCAVQNIAIRGHRDDGRVFSKNESVIHNMNDGNFRHLLRFRIAAGDLELKNNLLLAPSNALYTSKTTQNEILEIMGSMLKKAVANRIKKSKFWTLLADETTDRQSREQMVLVARYVYNQQDSGYDYVIREDAFSIIDALKEAEILRQNSDKPPGLSDERKLDGATLGRIFLSQAAKAGLGISNIFLVN